MDRLEWNQRTWKCGNCFYNYGLSVFVQDRIPFYSNYFALRYTLLNVNNRELITFSLNFIRRMHYLLNIRPNTEKLFVCTKNFSYTHILHVLIWAGIAQSVQRLATSWTVQGTNTGGGEIFSTRPERPWGPPSLLYNGYRVIPGVKRLGRGVDHPPTSSAEVKERIELYLYSRSGPSWPVLG